MGVEICREHNEERVLGISETGGILGCKRESKKTQFNKKTENFGIN